ncbi:MAG: hypothetical protein IT371_31095 [Deltaproteobacteria bacterium]|nr:hypothetical protein [Deltaproteobacteria bacterium]
MTNPGTLDIAPGPSLAARPSTDAGPSLRPSLADLEDRIDLHGPLEEDPIVGWLCGWRVRLLAPVNGRPAGTPGHVVPMEHPAWQRCNRRHLLPVEAGSELVMVPFADLAMAGAGPREVGESLESWLERCLRAGDLEVILAQRPDGLAPSAQAHLALYRAAALRHAGRPEETLSALADARSLFQTSEQRVDAARLRCGAFRDRQRPAEALLVGREVEPLLASVSGRTRGRFLTALAFAYHAAGRAEDAGRLLTEAESCAAEPGDALTSGEIALVRGCLLRGSAPEAALVSQTAALRHFQTAGAIPECGYALGNLMLLAMDRLDAGPPSREVVWRLLGLCSAAAACFRVARNRPALQKVFSLLVEKERDPVRALDQLDELVALDPGATASDPLHHFVRGQRELAAQRWDQAEASLACAAHLISEDEDPEGAAKIAARRSLLATGRSDEAAARAHLAHAEALVGDMHDSATGDTLGQAGWAVEFLSDLPGPELRDLALAQSVPGGALSHWGSASVRELLEQEQASIVEWASDGLSALDPALLELDLDHLVGTLFRHGRCLAHVFFRRGRPSPSVAVPLGPGILRRWLAQLEHPETREHALVSAAVNTALSAGEVGAALPIQFAVATCLGEDPELARPRELLTDILRVTLVRGLTLEVMVDAAAREVEEQLNARAVAHELGEPPTDSGIEAPLLAQAQARFSKPKRNWRDQLRSLTRLLEPTACPWPRDLRCRCGADLRPYIFCCDHTQPVDYAAHAPRLRGGYVIPCDLCGGELHGFRCDACGQVLTWDLGVVPTLKGEN